MKVVVVVVAVVGGGFGDLADAAAPSQLFGVRQDSHTAVPDFQSERIRHLKKLLIGSAREGFSGNGNSELGNK